MAETSIREHNFVRKHSLTIASAGIPAGSFSGLFKGLEEAGEPVGD